MLHLLTLGVLAFQLTILVTMMACALMGRRWLNIACIGWVGFTLFGSIYTYGLMLLQLVTIAVSYAIGRLILRRMAKRQEGGAGARI